MAVDSREDPALPGASRLRILVVLAESAERDRCLEWLASAGHDVISANTFQEGKQALDVRPPDLLIADLKLAAFNGLHLAIRARLSAGTPAIIIGDDDPLLMAEVMRHQTMFLPRPLDCDAVLEMVAHVLRQRRQATRRSPRNRVERMGASVDGQDATLIDLSYEGLRLELPLSRATGIPATFTVHVPSFDVTCRAQRVWIGEVPGETPALCCGAMVDGDGTGALAWRRFVDLVRERESGVRS